MLNRRHFSYGLCGCATMLAQPIQTAASAKYLDCENACDTGNRGCRSNAFDIQQNYDSDIENASRYFSSSSSSVDSNFRNIANILKRILNVNAPYLYYNDPSRGRAIAYPRGAFRNGPEVILFGRNLIRKEMQNKTAGTVTLAALFAHEFAHIKQFEVDCDLKSIIGSTYCRRIELQADYMAGWALYHYLREEFYGSTLTLNAVGNAWRSLAPSDVNKQSTHGGPSQRVDALGAGYEFALRNNDSNIGTGVVMYEGAQYVRKFT